MKNFNNLIHNKRVLLLGPAEHILIEKNTSDFRDFDVVVKLNKMVEQASFSCEELNQRNDVLYHCLQIDIGNGDQPYSLDLWKKMDVKHVRIPFSGTSIHYRMNINRFLQNNKNYNFSYSVCPIQEFEKLNIDCDNTLPSTGIAAINDLVLRKPKELHIRGLTFGKTGYCKSYKNEQWHKNSQRRAKTTKHRPEKQFIFFKKLLKSNKCIIIDQELKNII
jgi:hypothetical protein